VTASWEVLDLGMESPKNYVCKSMFQEGLQWDIKLVYRYLGNFARNTPMSRFHKSRI
jgi:hypothetical protein